MISVDKVNEKLTKSESGYTVPKRTKDPLGLRCDNCFFYSNEYDHSQSRSQCTLVKGNILPGAVCNLWSRTHNVDLSFSSSDDCHKILKEHKLAKSESGYINVTRTKSVKPKRKGYGTRCGSCIFFGASKNSSVGGCKLVEGKINEYACCNLWKENKNDKDVPFLSGEECKDILLDIEELV